MKGSPAGTAWSRSVSLGLPTTCTVYRDPGEPEEGKPGWNSLEQKRKPWFTNNLHGIPGPGRAGGREARLEQPGAEA